MLTDKDWNLIRTAVDEVVDRQVDEVITVGTRVKREPDGSVVIRLEHNPQMEGLNLEPPELADVLHRMTPPTIKEI